MIDKIINEMSIEEKVGQLCVPILQADHITDDIRKQITEYKIGTIRYCPNAEFDNGSVIVGRPNKYFKPNETAEFLNSLQELSKYPLLISVDQEGGTRSDINRAGAIVYASHMCFGAADDEKLSYEIAKATAEEFRAMGINLVQAPICDVFRYPGRQTMKAASFGEDEEAVTRHSIAMKRGLNDGGVISMAKHFPGYGSIATDAHKGTAHIVKTAKELEKEDILPFKAMIKDGLDAVMTGHVIVDAIDSKYPATLSKTLLGSYLREGLGFDGLIMTDAMRMKSIQDNYGTGAASVMAVQAGCDLILLRGDFSHFKEGYEAILKAARNGEISEGDIDKSLKRIFKAKESLGLFKNRYADPNAASKIVGCLAHKDLIKQLSSKSISVLKEKNLPLKADKDTKIAVISCEMQKIAAATDDIQCIDMLQKEICAISKEAKGLVVKISPDENDIASAVELAMDSDVIILGLCSAIIFKEQIKLYEALRDLGKALIVVAMESPYDIELIPDCQNYLVSYGPARDWMRVISMRIFGLTKVNAICPVTIKY